MEVLNPPKVSVKSSRDLAQIIKSILDAREPDELHKEYFYSVGLNQKNHILYICIEGIGTVNYATPIIREIFRNAIIKNAVSIICAHNHPSGEVLPSREDKDFTRKLTEAGRIMGVKCLDHLIIGDNATDLIYRSFADEGEL